MRTIANVALGGVLCLASLSAAADDIIIDNGGTGFSTAGTWSTSIFDAGYYGSNYLQDGTAGADTGKTATWTPAIPVAGDYLIYMRWPAAANRPGAAPLEIKHSAGIDSSKSVNQQTGGGNWVLIGQYALSAGSTNYVRINASAAGFTIADAVRFEPTTSVNVALGKPVTVDSTDGANAGANAVDGVIDDSSRWLSANTPGPHTLAVDLGATSSLICAHLHTGYGSGSAVASAKLQSWSGSAWADIPGAAVSGNTGTDVNFCSPTPSVRVACGCIQPIMATYGSRS